MNLNATHDPKRRSFVEAANAGDTDFPIQNLPYGIFSHGTEPPRVGVAIGDTILDLAVLEAEGVLRPSAAEPVFDRDTLNAFMALGREVWSSTRAAIADLLDAANPRLRDNATLRARALRPLIGAKLHLPVFVRSYTDFYASKEHATNVGAMFRDPANAMLPNWLHIPIGYNGRASTVVVSGTPIHRPLGQTKTPDAEAPSFGPSAKLDYELELGAIIGTPSRMGQPVSVAEAEAMIFGYVLLNDWSARDIQAWEYQPLGPFQSKAFGTTISPWIVTAEALAPFRVPTPARVKPLLPYLVEHEPYNLDLSLEIEVKTARGASAVVSRTNASLLYYSAPQQLAHHAVSGCAMEVGDLIGSGTISGPTRESVGSLLEATLNGKTPISLGPNESRAFLEDGDSVVMRACAQVKDYRIGFGTCEGIILPAPRLDEGSAA